MGYSPWGLKRAGQDRVTEQAHGHGDGNVEQSLVPESHVFSSKVKLIPPGLWIPVSTMPSSVLFLVQIFFFIFFSSIVSYKILNIVSCAIE